MKKPIAILAILVLPISLSWAEQKYNPCERRWETVEPGWTLQYNPMARSWRYAPPDATPQYNPNWLIVGS